MREKLTSILSSYDEITAKLSDQAVLNDQKEYARLAKEHSGMTPLATKIREYFGVLDGIAEAKEILKTESDAEMKDLAKDELDELEQRVEPLEDELKVMMLPADPNDEKNVIVEIRAGAGGDEAGLFAGDLYRMYTRYAEAQRWKVEEIDASENEVGGYKDVSFMIKGKGVYSKMKFESGVHRVQRVPVTEASGRIHTSACTVAVLPEAEEVDVRIDAKDIRIDTFCSSGPGGQSVNTTDSAVRITHLPTGIVVSCQNERSQLQNKESAMRMLRARLVAAAEEQAAAEASAARRSQVRTVDRSERIRTYNFGENRIADHRIGYKAYNLDAVLAGDLGGVIQALQAADLAERLDQIG